MLQIIARAKQKVTKVRSEWTSWLQVAFYMTIGTWPTGRPLLQAAGPAVPLDTQVVLLTTPLMSVTNCISDNCNSLQTWECMHLHV